MAFDPKPIPFEPDRFRTAASHYEEGRVPYAPALIRRVAEVTGLGPRHRLLDLGCGPGPLARAFAPLVAEVVAMDPSEDMLAAARTLAAEAQAANIRFVAGSSYDLSPELGPFHLVVMGRSFHWMDRADTLKRLDRMIERGGAVALFFDSAPALPVNAWRDMWSKIRERYENTAYRRRRAGGWVCHEAFLLESAFCRLEQFGVIERRPLDVETVVKRTLSMSSTSPSHLGESKTGALIADLRAALAGVREEVVETSALVAWRAR
ncbi:MAG TPA: class I SAM-dependent methyltransferase [Reyranella sp.]|nr:class I SAM-dependent methyltransferase [Reyranella sp.]